MRVQGLISFKNCQFAVSPVFMSPDDQKVSQLLILGWFWVLDNLEYSRNILKSWNSDDEIRDVLNLCLNIDLKHMYYKSSYSKVIV